MPLALALLVAVLTLLAGAADAAARGSPPAAKPPVQNAPGPVQNAPGEDEPIEINADRLEVQQDRQVAIFRGNVEATQGAIRLRADELKVYYRAADRAQKQADPPAPGGSISRIDATGHVFVSSPEEAAQGAAGTYDVLRKEIVLTGEVVLTRGANVIRGDRLVLNLLTGHSRVEANAAGGRVRGLFQPPKSGQKPATR